MARRRFRRVGRQRAGRGFVILGAAVLGALAAALVLRTALLGLAIDQALAAHGLGDARYRIAGVGLTATRIVDIELGAELASRELMLHYRPARLPRLELDKITVSGLRLDVAGDPGPLARRLARDGGAAGEPPHLPPLHITDGTVRLSGALAVALADLTVDPLAGAGYEMAAARLMVSSGDRRIAAEGLTASLAWDDGFEQAKGEFAIASLADDSDAPVVAPVALSGSMARRADTWNAMATARAARGVTVQLQASYAADGTVRARFTVPPLHFVPGALQPADLVPGLAAMEAVSGTIAGHLAVLWRPGHPVSPDGALRIDDLSFAAGGVPVESLSARIVLAGEGPAAEPVLRVETAQLALAGGRIAADGVLFRPLADSNRLTLRVSDLDLAVLLAALDIEGVSGQGAFDGALPLVVAQDDVAIESGRLAAQRPGVLRIGSPEAAAALAQGGADTDLLARALADFRYERLEVSLDKPLSGESRLALSMLGHNPAVLDGHPFQINVTVTANLDKILGAVAQGGRLSQDIIRAMVGAARQ